MPINFDIKDPKNQKLVAMFLVPIVVMYAFFHFVVQTKIEEVNKRNANIIELQNRLNNIEKTIGTKAALVAQKEELTKKFEELNSLLPSVENVSHLLDQFTAVEQESKVYLVGFNASEIVESEERPYRANKYKVTIEAGYHQFLRFMSSILALPRILSFSNIKMTMNPLAVEQTETYEGLEDQPRYLTIDCVLTSYVFKDIDVEKPSQEGSSKADKKKK